MPHFTADNTFGYEPAGIKLLNKVFDRVAELDPGAKAREHKIAQAILDVVYDDSGNIDVADLTRQVLAKLGAPG